MKDYKTIIPEDFWRGDIKTQVATTVGELIEILKKLPEELPLSLDFAEAIEVAVYNVDEESRICVLFNEYDEDDSDEDGE